ncbi:MAG: hypothetical protein JNL38_02080 [Myxococcales bacterium]|nr:hypothetical protein [Myxococcales bacterium]
MKLARLLSALLSVSLSLASLPLSGCATIFTGSKTTLSVSASPSDADVTVRDTSGAELYKGPPTSVEVSKKRALTVHVEADGYETQTVGVGQSISGATFANILFVIPILIGVGVAVDAFSGALNSLSPTDIRVTLRPKHRTPKPTPTPPPAESDAP